MNINDMAFSVTLGSIPHISTSEFGGLKFFKFYQAD
jgi:hypothetical protein